MSMLQDWMLFTRINFFPFQEPIKEEEMETEKVKPVTTAPAAPTEIPTKCVTSRIKTQVNCKVKFIDFEGRSDGESIKRILGNNSSCRHFGAVTLYTCTFARGKFCL